MKECTFELPGGAVLRMYQVSEGKGTQFPEFMLELSGKKQGGEGELRARIKIAAGGHGYEPFKRFLIISAEEGEPLKVEGNNYRFTFKDTVPSFYPEGHSFRLDSITKEGYTVAFPRYALSSLRLTCTEVPPPGEIDI